jgi:hypothetical protein
MAQGKRYKFQGSTFQIGVGYGASKNITNVTQADPAVVSVAAHGYSEGAVVLVEEVPGMIELNGNLYVVDDPASGTFELAGVDSTGYTAFVSGSPSGNVRAITFSDFCELTGVNQQDGTADEIEVTTICSNAKEFEVGLSDSGSLTLDFNLAPNQTVQAFLRQAKADGTDVAFKVTFPGDGGSLIMLGNVQATSFQGSVNGVWTGSATIKLTGEIFVLAA